MDIESFVRSCADLDDLELMDAIDSFERASEAVLDLLYGRLMSVRNRQSESRRTLVAGLCGEAATDPERDLVGSL